MGISSAGPQETVSLGEGSCADLENTQDGGANTSIDMEETRDGVATNSRDSTPHSNSKRIDLGVGTDSRGYGSASFAECLNRLGVMTDLADPATLASGVIVVDNLSQTDPPQSMSPTQVRPFLRIHSI